MLYLFPFTFRAPELSPTYPRTQPHASHKWPDNIKRWAQGSKLNDLGATKYTFFRYKRSWFDIDVPETTKADWKEEDPPLALWRRLVKELHDKHLWFAAIHEMPDPALVLPWGAPIFEPGWSPKYSLDLSKIPPALRAIIDGRESCVT